MPGVTGAGAGRGADWGGGVAGGEGWLSLPLTEGARGGVVAERDGPGCWGVRDYGPWLGGAPTSGFGHPLLPRRRGWCHGASVCGGAGGPPGYFLQGMRVSHCHAALWLALGPVAIWMTVLRPQLKGTTPNPYPPSWEFALVTVSTSYVQGSLSQPLSRRARSTICLLELHPIGSEARNR